MGRLSAGETLVSVLMPAYNHERFVAASIASVIAQTYRPLELIVVDDGSTDSTPSVIARTAGDAHRQLDRFVFARERHGGIPRTLNRALRRARGQFVAILASDDVYLPAKIERLLAVPEWRDPRTGAVFGDAHYIDADGARIGLLEDHSIAHRDDPSAKTHGIEDLMRWRTEPEPGPLGSYASILRGPYIPAVSTLVRRTAMEEIGNFDETMFVEDYGMWLHLAREHRIVAVPEVVGEKRIHGSNASLVRQRHVFRDMLELTIREKPFARSDPVAAAERAAARDRNYRAVRIYGTRGDLVRIIVRHPFVAPRDLLEARGAGSIG